MKKVLKIILILISIYIFLIVIASPLTKYMIQRYDYKLTGREITLDNVFINPLGGRATIRRMSVFEYENDTVFFYAGKISTDMSLLKLLTGNYEVKSLKINNPEIRVFRHDSVFNFSDLMDRFLIVDTLDKEELHLNILDITIRNGIVRYSEPGITGTTNFSGIDFKSPGFKWNVDSITGTFSLIPASGTTSGSFMLNIDSLDYRLKLILNDFNSAAFNQYTENFFSGINISSDSDIQLNIQGNLNKLLQGKGSGRVVINDFNMVKDRTVEYLSFEEFLVSFRDINLEDKKFYFDSIRLSKPFILYQLFDTLDNFRRLVPFRIEEEAKDKEDTAEMLLDLKGADYYVNNLAITGGKFEFNDYSINSKFTFIIDLLNINADTIDKRNKRININTDARIYPSGTITTSLSMDPENEKNLDFKYSVADVPATLFNPYIISISSYPLDRGTIEMNGQWHIRNSKINSLNHFLVIDPRDTKRVRRRDNKWIPLPLIMSFVRERGGVIDYEIPVEGDLSDPEFNLWDVVTDILKNILVKPPTTPYRLQVKSLKEEVEKNLSVTWQMQQFEIADNQKKFMKGIAEFLKTNPQSKIVVQPVYHEEKEKENILFFLAKKKYFFESEGKPFTTLSKNDSLKLLRLSTRDSLFVLYLNKNLKNPGMYTIQEKCYILVGRELVQETYNNLKRLRNVAFLQFFKDNNTSNQVEILEPKISIPYNWFSYYDINYKGGVPESLREAFNKLYELNEEPPSEDFIIRRR
ncbi:MAG TPA: DUF748 domain-containing protein [Bacteroidales bacterium]|nr:DUF748 domain-containing protein [Bacteroidales bacterium]